jgi:hypothetical protein
VAIRVVYRSHGGENAKDRPAYYSKLLGLLSFLRATDGMDLDIVYVNDGPIPEDRFRLMTATGETVALPGLGMRGSYRAALQVATSGRWSREDVAWFSEDDYLYREDAFRRLEQAIVTLDDAEYFALYASTPDHPAERDDDMPAHRPSGWRWLPPWRVDDQAWVRIYSTTSSFGARIGALQDDMGIFRFCMVPHVRMLRDHDTCLLLQGFEPYSYTELAREAVGRGDGDGRARARAAALAPFRLATNLRAHRRPSRRRLFLAADPNLATHMETGLIAEGADWPAVAQETWAWAAQRGLLDPADAAPHVGA